MTRKKDKIRESLFRRLWSGWKKIARKIGDFNARVILTIFYLVLLSPFALMVRLLSDPLNIKKGGPKKGWLDREETEGISPLDKAQRQF